MKRDLETNISVRTAMRSMVYDLRYCRKYGVHRHTARIAKNIGILFKSRHTTQVNQSGFPDNYEFKMEKPSVYIRTAFDKESRIISRYVARRILQMNRRTARRITGGWKFIHGFEPTVITRSPWPHEVNF